MGSRDDPVRLLGWQIGYTSNPLAALPREPEAVSEEEPSRQTSRARRSEKQRLASAWRTAHSQIDGALERFKREGHPDKQRLSDARVIERTARRIRERLGA